MQKYWSEATMQLKKSGAQNRAYSGRLARLNQFELLAKDEPSSWFETLFLDELDLFHHGQGLGQVGLHQFSYAV